MLPQGVRLLLVPFNAPIEDRAPKPLQKETPSSQPAPFSNEPPKPRSEAEDKGAKASKPAATALEPKSTAAPSVPKQQPKRPLKPWEKMAANFPEQSESKHSTPQGPEEPPPIEWDEIAGAGDNQPNWSPPSAPSLKPEKSQSETPQMKTPQVTPSAARGGPQTASFADFVKIIKKQRPTLSGTLTLVRPLQFEPGRVLLGCESAFDLSTISSPTVHSYLQEALTSFFRRETTLEVERVSADTPKQGAKMPQTLDEAAISVRQQKRYEIIRQAKIHPAVKAIRDELNAEVGRVRILSPDLEG